MNCVSSDHIARGSSRLTLKVPQQIWMKLQLGHLKECKWITLYFNMVSGRFCSSVQILVLVLHENKEGESTTNYDNEIYIYKMDKPLAFFSFLSSCADLCTPQSVCLCVRVCVYAREAVPAWCWHWLRAETTTAAAAGRPDFFIAVHTRGSHVMCATFTHPLRHTLVHTVSPGT